MHYTFKKTAAVCIIAGLCSMTALSSAMADGVGGVGHDVPGGGHVYTGTGAHHNGAAADCSFCGDSAPAANPNPAPTTTPAPAPAPRMAPLPPAPPAVKNCHEALYCQNVLIKKLGASLTQEIVKKVNECACEKLKMTTTMSVVNGRKVFTHDCTCGGEAINVSQGITQADGPTTGTVLDIAE